MLESINEDSIEAAQAILYPEELYHFDSVAEGIWGGFEAVTDADVQFFHDRGYLVIHDAFSPEEVSETLDGMLHLMDGKNPDYRGIQYEPKLVKHRSELSTKERRDIIRKIASFVKFEPRLKAISEHEGLIAVVQRLIEDDP